MSDTTPYERMQLLKGPVVRIHMLRVSEDSRGVERLWQISCMLPELSHENSGLLQLGLESTDARLRRILGLSLCGTTTLVKSWVENLATGKSCLVMTVEQLESDTDPLKTQ